MKITTYLGYCIVALLMTACSGASQNVSQPNTQTSRWTQNVPIDTPQYYYALGYGRTLEEAKNDALAAISAKIGVQIDSTFQSSVTARRFDENEEVVRKIRSDTVAKAKRIEYTNAQIVRSTFAKDKEEYIVLVRVDRKELARNYKRKLDDVDTQIRTLWQAFEGASKFEKIKIAQKIKRLLRQSDEIFPLLHAIDPNFDDAAYVRRYRKYTQTMTALGRDLRVKLEYDRNSQALAELIASYLSKEGTHIRNRDYDVLVRITTQAKRRTYDSANERFQNVVVALRKTTIRVYDENGVLVSQAVYKTKEGSQKGFEDAIEKTGKYEKKIKKLGIFGFIVGIE